MCHVDVVVYNFRLVPCVGNSWYYKKASFVWSVNTFVLFGGWLSHVIYIGFMYYIYLVQCILIFLYVCLTSCVKFVIYILQKTCNIRIYVYYIFFLFSVVNILSKFSSYIVYADLRSVTDNFFWHNFFLQRDVYF